MSKAIDSKHKFDYATYLQNKNNNINKVAMKIIDLQDYCESIGIDYKECILKAEELIEIDENTMEDGGVDCLLGYHDPLVLSKIK